MTVSVTETTQGSAAERATWSRTAGRATWSQPAQHGASQHGAF